ncbi:MAG: redoxin domain-containing protein [Oceanicoccus sp.]
MATKLAKRLLTMGVLSSTLLFAVFGTLVSTASASDSVIGMRVDDFELLDHQGAAHRLYYYDDAPAIVLMVQGNGCPIVRNVMPGLRDVRDVYAKKGVKFLLLNSNLQDNRASIAAEVEEFGYDIPVLVDSSQLVGESLKVSRTAEVFVIDPKTKKVVYHGPVDDRVTYEVQKNKADNHYLSDALDAVLAGEAVKEADIDAPGCIINFPENDKRDRHAEISYHDTIVPLLEKNCVGCHQVGGIGPWAMSSYEMVKGFSPMIREVIRTDRMPPWHADPEVGHFLRDKSLTSNEIKTLVHWIEAGSPRGEGPDPLAVPREPLKEWPLGKPDMIVKLPAFTIPATGIVDYQYPVIDNPLTEPKWLKASTVKVGAREAVHHVLSGMMKEKPANGRGGQRNWGSSIGGYAVGAESNIARQDHGTYLPVGGAIGFQLHYTTFGKEATDQTEIGLYFYKDDELPELMTRRSVVIDVSIEIPANTAGHEETSYLEFPHDAILLGAFPHAHYRGQSSTLTIRYPDGTEELLLSLPRYDFNWQRDYEFTEPVEVPAGSKLIAVNAYDNSSQNPANPDPSGVITWGEQSHEEMLFTAISYRWKDETRVNQKPEYSKQLDDTRMFGMLDDNVNDMLEKSELKGRVGNMIAASFDRLDSDNDGALSHDEFAAVAAMMAQR